MENEDKIFDDLVHSAGNIMSPSEIAAREEMGDEAYEKLQTYIETNQELGLQQVEARTRYINGLAFLYESIGYAIERFANKYLGS